MTYRNDVDALAARHAALEAEVAAKTKELAAAAHVLDEARDRARLPVLDNIRVASPCPVEWTQMTPVTNDDRVRACAQCNKNVYNLSSLTRDEAEALIVERNGNLCIRYFQRADGTIMLADCVVGAARKTKRRLIAAGAATLLASAGIGMAVRGHEHHCAKPTALVDPSEHIDVVTGQMRIDPPPQEVRGLMTTAPPEANAEFSSNLHDGKQKPKVSKIQRHEP